MVYTSHGHHIPLSPSELFKSSKVVRCGGPRLCQTCQMETSKWVSDLEQKNKEQQVELEIKRFVPKPVAIEAVKITMQNYEEVAKWCGGDVVSVSEVGAAIRIPGLIDSRIAACNDYVVKGDTHFFPMYETTFEKKYTEL